MPIRLNDVLVDFISDDDDTNDDEEQEQVFTFHCTLCKEQLILEGSNDYNPKEHTLNYCLNILYYNGAKL